MPDSLDSITAEIVDAGLRLHKALGPGLLESVYLSLLSRDLERRGLAVRVNRPVSFEYDGIRFDHGLCVDLLVNDQVIVELKSVENLAPVHYKQVMTYLRLLDLRVGLLINFGSATFKEGLHRIVNGLEEDNRRPLPTLRARPTTDPSTPHQRSARVQYPARSPRE